MAGASIDIAENSQKWRFVSGRETVAGKQVRRQLVTEPTPLSEEEGRASTREGHTMLPPGLIIYNHPPNQPF